MTNYWVGEIHVKDDKTQMIFFTNLTSKPIRRAVFRRIGRAIMPKNYDLSVVFAPLSLMKKLNKTYRGKDKPANVLSFSLMNALSRQNFRKRRNVCGRGEIFLNVEEQDLPALFVHGCLHMLGFDHKTSKEAKKMKEQERAIFTKTEK